MSQREGSAPIPLFATGSAPSERIGGYDIIGQLARGGMGTVYLCRRVGEAGFQRLFAVKLMHEHLAEDEQFINMLLDEARLAARIHHHNVVSIVDLGTDRVGHYVVMEYIEGCSLSQMLKKGGGPPPPRLAIPLMVDALNGLHAAHTVPDDYGEPMKLVHRDVSPQNILVGLDGVARITDFGIATARSRITSTRPGVHKGKLAYSAPEQLNGTTDIDARVDVFAAGAVLWSLLTGRRLFRGRTDAETINNLLRRPVLPPSKLAERVPKVFDNICLRALQRDRSLRYPSAASMADALHQAAMDEGCLGQPSEIADWVRYSFAEELEARRAAIRDARTDASRSRTPLPGPNAPGTNPSGTFATRSTFKSLPEQPSDALDIGTKPQRRWLRYALVAGAAAVLGLIAASRLGSSDRSPPAEPRAAASTTPDPAPKPDRAPEPDETVSKPRSAPSSAPKTDAPAPDDDAAPNADAPEEVQTPRVTVKPSAPSAIPPKPQVRRRPSPRPRRQAPRPIAHRRPSPAKKPPARSTNTTEPKTAVAEPKARADAKPKPRSRKRGDDDVLSPRLEENPYLRND